jgi:hypothetical protein
MPFSEQDSASGAVDLACGFAPIDLGGPIANRSGDRAIDEPGDDDLSSDSATDDQQDMEWCA